MTEANYDRVDAAYLFRAFLKMFEEGRPGHLLASPDSGGELETIDSLFARAIEGAEALDRVVPAEAYGSHNELCGVFAYDHLDVHDPLPLALYDTPMPALQVVHEWANRLGMLKTSRFARYEIAPVVVEHADVAAYETQALAKEASGRASPGAYVCWSLYGRADPETSGSVHIGDYNTEAAALAIYAAITGRPSPAPTGRRVYLEA